MKKKKTVKTVSGSALVIALLILLAMTIVGVATLASVNMQERMAGNANLQSLAFESAAAGLSEALSWAFRIDVQDDDLAWGDCSRAAGTRTGTPGPAQTLKLHDDAVQMVGLQYSLTNACLEAPDAVVVDDPTFLPPLQFFVTSEGTVSASDSTPLARREIEVLISNIRGDGLSGIRIEGEAEVTFDAANSNKFVVDGGGGAAISASSVVNSSLITNDILDKDRIENYVGGIVQSTYPPPFNSADGLARFALMIKGYMLYRGVPDIDDNVNVSDYCDGTAAPRDRTGTARPTMRFVDGDLSIGNGSVQGITYVTGNFTAAGNASGSGVLIVEGTIDTNGTPDFDGLIVALGGSIDMSGGGRGVTNGMVFATNLPLNRPLETEDVNRAYGERIDPLNGWSSGWLNPAPDDLNPDDVPGLFHLIGDPEYVTGPFDGEGVVPYKELLKIGDDDNDPFGPDGFGPTTMSFAGGGNHTFNYDCDNVDAIRKFLQSCEGEVGIDGEKRSAYLGDDWTAFECDVPGKGAAIAAIRSWRENLGWRELLR